MGKRLEIEAGLDACRKAGISGCAECPYSPARCEELHAEALDLIRKMRERIIRQEKTIMDLKKAEAEKEEAP